MYEHFIKSLIDISNPPLLFEPGNASFWDDPYISSQLLNYHLDPSIEAASRPPERIDAQVANLVSTGVFKPGDRVLDLECGPGLYDIRLARHGLQVTGVDISARSLNYAIEYARKYVLAIQYRRLDFRHLDYLNEFDAVIQVYGELNTFSDADRDSLLKHIHTTLKPGGLLVFDASTRVHRMKNRTVNRWYFTVGGLWRQGHHLVLENGFDYPEHDVFCSQYCVIDTSGTAVYRFWFHDYNLDTLCEVLKANGFRIEYSWNDLDGTPYSPGGEWLAVAAGKQVT